MNRNTFNKSVVPGLFSFAVDAYKRRGEEWRQLVNMAGAVRGSRRAYEESAYYAGLGTVPTKPEGAPIDYDDFVQGPTKRWTHVTYGLGTRVTEEVIEDSLYPDVPTSMRAQTEELGDSAGETLNLLTYDIINNGANTNTHTGGDGLAIFSASHTSLRGGTWSNLLSPAADLSATTLQDAIRQFETTKDDTGKYQRIRPKWLLVPPQLEWKARELLNSAFDPESANNSVNTLKTRNLQLMVSPYLTDTDAFTLIAEPPHSDGGIIAFLRRKVTFARDGDFQTGDALFKATFRFSIEVNKANNLFHSAGA